MDILITTYHFPAADETLLFITEYNKSLQVAVLQNELHLP